MKIRKESYLSYCFLGLCHLILYRTMGDSEAENINWYDSLSDKEDARKRAVSEDGGGQGGAEQGRCAESRPGDRTEYVQIQSGWRWCSSCCHSCRRGSRVPSQAPLATAPSRALPEARCRDGERCSQRGSEGKRRMSQAGPEKRRIKAMCEPSPDSGKALPRPWSSMAQGHQASRELEGAMDSPYPNPNHPACMEGHIHTEGRT